MLDDLYASRFCTLLVPLIWKVICVLIRDSTEWCYLFLEFRLLIVQDVRLQKHSCCSDSWQCLIPLRITAFVLLFILLLMSNLIYCRLQTSFLPLYSSHKSLHIIYRFVAPYYLIICIFVLTTRKPIRWGQP